MAAGLGFLNLDNLRNKANMSDSPKLPNSDSDREGRASVVNLRKSDLLDQCEMPASF